MKALRYIKLRTFSRGPLDMILDKNNNPLKEYNKIDHPTHEFTSQFLASFRKPMDAENAGEEL